MKESVNRGFGQSVNYLTESKQNGIQITTQTVDRKVTGEHATIWSKNIERSEYYVAV
jgi:hypothetical protein